MSNSSRKIRRNMNKLTRRQVESVTIETLMGQKIPFAHLKDGRTIAGWNGKGTYRPKHLVQLNTPLMNPVEVDMNPEYDEIVEALEDV